MSLKEKKTRSKASLQRLLLLRKIPRQTYNFSAQTNMALKKIGQHIRTMEWHFCSYCLETAVDQNFSGAQRETCHWKRKRTRPKVSLQRPLRNCTNKHDIEKSNKQGQRTMNKGGTNKHGIEEEKETNKDKRTIKWSICHAKWLKSKTVLENSKTGLNPSAIYGINLDETAMS